MSHVTVPPQVLLSAQDRVPRDLLYWVATELIWLTVVKWMPFQTMPSGQTCKVKESLPPVNHQVHLTTLMKFKDFQGTCQPCKYPLDAELTWKGIPLQAGRETQQLLCQNKSLHYYSHFLFWRAMWNVAQRHDRRAVDRKQTNKQ